MSNRNDKRKTHGNEHRCECLKRQYDKEAARRVAARSREDLVPYKCPFVKAVWHIGHPTIAPVTSREEGREVAAKRNARLGRGV